MVRRHRPPRAATTPARADTCPMRLRALTWNVFHGRDFPPDRSLMTCRSRLLGTSERNATHLQVNRDLFGEFAWVLAAAAWEVALLQECPPRWSDALARATGSSAHRVLTARNSCAPLRSALARLNPDLIASNEGGSNLTLVRGGAGAIAERDEFVLRRGPRPERRAMALSRLATGLCVANLHASTNPAHASEELLAAAAHAVEWARGAPTILGGDFNLRPRTSPELFRRLHAEHGFQGPSGPNEIDHLLARGLEPAEAPRVWPSARREVSADAVAIRLSDHPPVEGAFDRIAVT